LPFHGSNRGSNPLGDAINFALGWCAGVKGALRAARPVAKRECSVCGYTGWFGAFGVPLRPDARCPRCGSLERHRLLWLWLSSGGLSRLGATVVHFAAERAIRERLTDKIPSYFCFDLTGNVSVFANIESLPIRSGALSGVICNHVLEHVDDLRGLDEIARSLTEKGVLVCTVPQVRGWSRSHEFSYAVSQTKRELYFGQRDHVRIYGDDFVERVSSCGFRLTLAFQGDPDQCVKYSLVRGETLFIFTKE
jgi:SAM-dependent methyltransferase